MNGSIMSRNVSCLEADGSADRARGLRVCYRRKQKEACNPMNAHLVSLCTYVANGAPPNSGPERSTFRETRLAEARGWRRKQPAGQSRHVWFGQESAGPIEWEAKRRD